VFGSSDKTLMKTQDYELESGTKRSCAKKLRSNSSLFIAHRFNVPNRSGKLRLSTRQVVE